MLSAAAALQRIDAPGRRVILSERDNFPTDLYIAESVAESAGCELRLVDGTRVDEHLTTEVAVLMLTHVNYRTGRMHRMLETTRAAHAAGALVVWDLAHSAGAVPVDLHGADADFAIGCGYKYLNGGPGAPAFVWAHPRHTARMDREQLRQPLSGWLGHAAPFEFAPGYRPARGHRALRLRHAAGAGDGGARVRRRRLRARRRARRHGGAARQVDRPDRALHRPRRSALRRPRPRARHAARGRASAAARRASPTPTAIR